MFKFFSINSFSCFEKKNLIYIIFFFERFWSLRTYAFDCIFVVFYITIFLLNLFIKNLVLEWIMFFPISFSFVLCIRNNHTYGTVNESKKLFSRYKKCKILWKGSLVTISRLSIIDVWSSWNFWSSRSHFFVQFYFSLVYWILIICFQLN